MKFDSVAIIVLTVLLVLLSFSLSTTSGNLEKFKAEYAILQKQAALALAKSDSLEKVVTKRDQRIDSLTTKADTLAKKTASLTLTASNLRGQIRVLKDSASTIADFKTVIVAQDSLIAIQDSTLTTQSQQIFALRQTVSLQDSSILDLRLANARLKDALDHLPDPPKEAKFLGLFPLPSRMTVAGVTAVVTAAVVYEAVR